MLKLAEKVDREITNHVSGVYHISHKSITPSPFSHVTIPYGELNLESRQFTCHLPLSRILSYLKYYSSFPRVAERVVCNWIYENLENNKDIKNEVEWQPRSLRIIPCNQSLYTFDISYIWMLLIFRLVCMNKGMKARMSETQLSHTKSK